MSRFFYPTRVLLSPNMIDMYMRGLVDPSNCYEDNIDLNSPSAYGGYTIDPSSYNHFVHEISKVSSTGEKAPISLPYTKYFMVTAAESRTKIGNMFARTPAHTAYTSDAVLKPKVDQYVDHLMLNGLGTHPSEVAAKLNKSVSIVDKEGDVAKPVSVYVSESTSAYVVTPNFIASTPRGVLNPEISAAPKAVSATYPAGVTTFGRYHSSIDSMKNSLTATDAKLELLLSLLAADGPAFDKNKQYKHFSSLEPTFSALAMTTIGIGFEVDRLLGIAVNNASFMQPEVVINYKSGAKALAASAAAYATTTIGHVAKFGAFVTKLKSLKECNVVSFLVKGDEISGSVDYEIHMLIFDKWMNKVVALSLAEFKEVFGYTLSELSATPTLINLAMVTKLDDFMFDVKDLYLTSPKEKRANSFVLLPFKDSAPLSFAEFTRTKDSAGRILYSSFADVKYKYLMSYADYKAAVEEANKSKVLDRTEDIDDIHPKLPGDIAEDPSSQATTGKVWIYIGLSLVTAVALLK